MIDDLKDSQDSDSGSEIMVCSLPYATTCSLPYGVQPPLCSLPYATVAMQGEWSSVRLGLCSDALEGAAGENLAWASRI